MAALKPRKFNIEDSNIIQIGVEFEKKVRVRPEPLSGAAAPASRFRYAGGGGGSSSATAGAPLASVVCLAHARCIWRFRLWADTLDFPPWGRGQGRHSSRW